MPSSSETPVDTLFLELRAKSDKLRRDVDIAMRNVQQRVSRAGAGLQNAGRTLTRNISAPMTALSGGIIKVSADFQTAMNEVNANSRATETEFIQLRKIARELGGDRGIPGTARDAANAMNILAKNGVKANQLTKPLVSSMIRLAKATGGDFGLAADIATDAAGQFKKELSDMSEVVDGIVGVTLNSKFAIKDYNEALAQGGGVVGAYGVTLEDFNATLASSAFLFKSGSDAGTSFKTFMQFITGKSKEAKAIIDQTGLSFFDAAGKMRPMVEVAGELKRVFGDLSDKELNEKMTKLFGADAARTAIGLVEAGSEGMAKMKKEIASISTSDVLAKRLTGFNATMLFFKKVLADLFITLGDTGLLDNATRKLEFLATQLQKLAKLNPELLKFSTTILLIGSVLGPATIALGFFISGLSKVMGLLSPIGILFIAVAAGAALFAPELLDLAKAMDMGPALEALKGMLASIGFDLPALQGVKEKILAFRDGIINGFKGFKEKMKAMFNIDVVGILKITAAVAAMLFMFNPMVRGIRLVATSLMWLMARFKLGAAATAVWVAGHRILTGVIAAITGAFAGLVWTFQSNTTEGDLMRAMWEALKAAGKRFWEAVKRLGAALGDLFDTLNEVLDPIGGLEGGIQGLIAVIGSILVATIIAVITIFEKLITVVAWTIEKVNALIVEFTTGMPKIKASVNDMVNGVGNKLKKMGGALADAAGTVTGLGGSFRWLYNNVVGNSWIPDMVDGVIAHGRRMAAGFFQPVTREIHALGSDFSTLSTKTMPELQASIEAIQAQMDKLPIGSPAFAELNKQVVGINDAMSGATRQTRKLEMTAEEMKEGAFSELMSASQGFFDALIDGTASWKDAFKGAIADALTGIAKLIVKQQLLAAFGTAGEAAGGGGVWGAVATGIGAILGFAKGGRPPVGKASMVGEEGAELFVPDQAGTIFPNEFLNSKAQVNGPQTVVNNTFTSGVTWRDMAEIKRQWMAEALGGVVAKRSNGGSFRRAT